jgi:hypothetical protein
LSGRLVAVLAYFYLLRRICEANPATMAAVHEERFIPPRQKLDQLSIVKDYAAVPRLEYRYVLDRNRYGGIFLQGTSWRTERVCIIG